MTTFATPTRTTAAAPRLLRFALRLDGVVSTCTAVVLTPLAAVLRSALGIPTATLLGVGLFALVYGVAVLYVASRPTLTRRAGFVVAGLNALMTVECVVTLATGEFSLTALGVAGVVVFGLYTAAVGTFQAVAAAR